MSTQLLQIDFQPDRTTLRRFGYIALVAFGLLAACARFEVLMFAGGLGQWRDAVVTALAAAGAVAGLFSLVHPPANRPIWIVLTLITFPIGFVLSHVVMAVLFFGVFAPIGAVLRRLGRDPIDRKPSVGTESYWQPARPSRDKSRYFRQF